MYRHISWAFLAVIAILTFSFGASLVALLREVNIATICKAAFLILIYLVLVAFPVLSLRWRTVIDDENVTQHWITSTYRIRIAEITGLERDADSHRWYLRIRTGEKTFEVIPCYVLRRPGGAFNTAPPRTLLAVEADIETRLGQLT